ncbi:hypothetical protein FB451DRAFT_1164334 [Mycena latifolia]|nr:hypothetical protein FB451DRAFT_1164334 [Mycena latifolia]
MIRSGTREKEAEENITARIRHRRGLEPRARHGSSEESAISDFRLCVFGCWSESRVRVREGQFERQVEIVPGSPPGVGKTSLRGQMCGQVTLLHLRALLDVLPRDHRRRIHHQDPPPPPRARSPWYCRSGTPRARSASSEAASAFFRGADAAVYDLTSPETLWVLEG